MSAADPITTSVAYREGVAVVSVGGEIDLSTAPAFEAVITEALEADPAVLVIELSEGTFMASVGLRILAATQAGLAIWESGTWHKHQEESGLRPGGAKNPRAAIRSSRAQRA